jgi:hypothetical protein
MRTKLFLGLFLLAAPLAPPAYAQSRAPAPEAVLGFPVGADHQLASWEQIVDYVDRLGRASPRLTVERIGSSVEGREMIMAVITAPENHRRLEQIRREQGRLADPRGASGAELERIFARQPVVLFIGAGLHGNEALGPQSMVQLAYELATAPEHRAALRDVVVLLVPSQNPDGVDITRDWYLRNVGTPHAGAPIPWLYHHYTGHDNNRDFFMITQPETRAISRVLYERWFPNVVWDAHQMGNRGARYFIPPFADPLNPNLDPLLVRLTNLVGVQMAADMTAAGLTGISHAQTFDLWWHGGGRTVPARHNMVGILSEAASAGGLTPGAGGSDVATPILQRPEDLAQPQVGSMFPEPWEGGWWRPLDIVEYNLAAARSLLGLASRQRERLQRMYVQMAERQVEQGSVGGPFAFVVPEDQSDPHAAAELLRVLRRGGVEVHQARAPFTAGGLPYPAGTRLVLMAQPYRAHAKDLLEVQHYPERRQYPGGPPQRPYDLSGWTLPLQMGVEVVEVATPFTADLVRVDHPGVRAASVRGARGAVALVLDGATNGSRRAIHEVLAAGGRVTFTAESLHVGERSWPAGSPVVHGVEDLAERADAWATELGTGAAGLPAIPEGRTLDRLRVGLYRPWTASIDEGWTRWVFEQWAVPFDSLRDAEVRAGRLGERFDVVVIPAQSHAQLVQGHPRAHPEYAGGLGAEGVEALRTFVEDGGILVLLDGASELAIRSLGVPVRDLLSGQSRTDPDRWFAPGSLLRVEWNSSHPIAHGMPAEGAVFYGRSDFGGGPVFEVDPNAEGVRVVARWPERDVLMSGYAQGEDRIGGHAAVVEVQMGAGRVVMFGFRPQHRGQPHGTFRALFNALYLGAR